MKSIHISAPNCWSFSLIIFRVPIVRESTILLLTGFQVIYSSDYYRCYREHRCTFFLVNMLGLHVRVRLFSHRVQIHLVSIYISINCLGINYSYVLINIQFFLLSLVLTVHIQNKINKRLAEKFIFQKQNQYQN